MDSLLTAEDLYFLVRFQSIVQDAVKHKQLWESLMAWKAKDPHLVLPASRQSFLRSVRNIQKGGGPLNNFRLMKYLLRETQTSADFVFGSLDTRRAEDGAEKIGSVIKETARVAAREVVRILDSERPSRLSRNFANRRALVKRIAIRVSVVLELAGNSGHPESLIGMYLEFSRRERRRFLHDGPAMDAVDRILVGNDPLTQSLKPWQARAEWALLLGYQLAGLKIVLGPFWRAGRRKILEWFHGEPDTVVVDTLLGLAKPFGMVLDRLVEWGTIRTMPFLPNEARDAKLTVQALQLCLFGLISLYYEFLVNKRDGRVDHKSQMNRVPGAAILIFPSAVDLVVSSLIILNGLTRDEWEQDKFTQDLSALLGPVSFDEAVTRAQSLRLNCDRDYQILLEAHSTELNKDLSVFRNQVYDDLKSFTGTPSTPQAKSKSRAENAALSVPSESAPTDGMPWLTEALSELNKTLAGLIWPSSLVQGDAIPQKTGSLRNLVTPFDDESDDEFAFPNSVGKTPKSTPPKSS